MQRVIISLFATAAAFFAVGLTHFLVWQRGHRLREQLLFALTCLGNAVIVLFMVGVYSPASVAEIRGDDNNAIDILVPYWNDANSRYAIDLALSVDPGVKVTAGLFTLKACIRNCAWK